MRPACVECDGYDTDGLPGANFPPSWRAVSTAGRVGATWIPADIGNDHIYACQACGTYWRVGWNPRDGVFEGVSELRGAPAQLLPVGRPFGVSAPPDPEARMSLGAIVAQWLEGPAFHPENPINAIGDALAGRNGVLDGRGLRQCLQWLEAIVGRHESCARALACNQEVLELLGTLADRPRPVADRLDVPTRQLTRIIDVIGRRIEPVTAEWAACLRVPNAPEAIRERALAVLRARLEDARYPHELVLQALADLRSWEGATLEFDVGEVDSMLELYGREVARGPGPPAEIARGLHAAFESWLKSGILPAERRIAVLHAIEANAKALAAR